MPYAKHHRKEKEKERNKRRMKEGYWKKHNQRPRVKVRKRKYDEKYYEKNKDRLKEYGKEYYKNNKDEINTKYKEYYQKNKEEILKKGKEWRDNNVRKVMEIKSKYYEKNKDEIKEQKKEYYQRLVIKENKRRKKLRLPLIGEGWVKERELLNYVNNLFKEYEILKHCREPLMSWKPRGLELDIYIPELKLAFEYMGEQHYKWIKFFHKTKEEFEAQQYRDKCKKKICKQKGITLIRIKYDEDLSEQLVLSKLKYFNFPVVQKKI